MFFVHEVNRLSSSAKLFVFVGTLLGGLVLALPFRAAPRAKDRTESPQQPVAPIASTRVSLAIGGELAERNDAPPRDSEATQQAESVDLSRHITMNAYGENRLPEIESDYQSLLRPLPGRERVADAPPATDSQTVSTEREIPSELQSYPSTIPVAETDASRWVTEAVEPTEPRRLGTEITRRSRPVGGEFEPGVSVHPIPASPGWTARRAPVRSARTYRLRDGDTLRELAARFLGDANRAAEIHQLNRALIQHPEILPLGVEIQIPVP
jgi:phage tail protein X